MKHLILPILALLGTVQSQNPANAPAQTPAFRATSRLVNVDVIVTDKKGQPITDLKKEDFTVLERGKAQSISAFGIRSSGAAPAAQEQLPPGVFSNRPAPTGGDPVYTVLLLDGLNTKASDQMYGRQQMLRFLKTQKLAGHNVAVFALTRSLLRLQDFTTDPRILQAALDRAPRTEHLRDEPAREVPADIDEALPDFVPLALNRFAQEQANERLDVRVTVTLNSMASIGHWLASYPGRKNLLWLSASFPIQLNPSSTAGFGTQRNYVTMIRRTASILSNAQVSVYPIDARGLVGLSTFESAEVKGNAAVANTALAGGSGGGGLVLAEARGLNTNDSMREIAEATGGKSFYNRNDIDNAISKSLEDASSYYEIAYIPTDQKWDGEFRKVEIHVSRPNVVVRHRTGYFAQDYGFADDKLEAKREVMQAVGNPLAQTGVVFYGFSVPTERSSASPTADLRYIVPLSSFVTRTVSDTAKVFDLTFIAVALDSDGKAKSSAEDRAATELTNTQIRELWMGYPFRLSLKLPDGEKAYRLKLLVRDNISGRIGTLIIPAATK